MAIDDDLARITGAGLALEALRPELEALAPWPMAERFDHSPEAAWGPPEVLAHLEEMLAFWLGEIERVLAGPTEPVPFGRVATEAIRIGVIERDRSLPPRELFARVAVGIERLEQRLPELGPAEVARRGLHPTLGELTVGEIVPRFLADHLEDHIRQFEAILGRGPADAPPA